LSARGYLTWMAVLSTLGIALWLTAGWQRQAVVNDFVEYWAASRQLLVGENPYATRPILAVERGVGFHGQTALMMRNPPWTLPFVLPLGLFPYDTARRLWLCLSVASVLLSTHWLWRWYSPPGQPGWLGWLGAATFSPVATVLAIGQIGPLILLGISGFLDCQEKRRDVLAGAFALLVATKPHLPFLFWPALLLWVVSQRRWRILLGLTSAILIASAIPLMFDPAVFPHYVELWKYSGILGELVPTLGGLVRLSFGLHRNWLAFMPAIVAAAWLLFHWRSNGQHWDWYGQMPLLLLVSLTSTPFGWFFDQVVLLPCVLQAAAWVIKGGTGRWPVMAYLGINGLMLALILGQRTTFWYVWTAPAWLILYLWVRASHSKSPPDVSFPAGLSVSQPRALG
jgi:hypothetical protein